MAESEIPVQLDRASRVSYRSPNVASPKPSLGEHILSVWIFTIECHCLKRGIPRFTHQWSEILERPVTPLHDERAGDPEVGVREVGIERERLFEQAVGRHAIGRGSLVHVPEATLAIIPGTHVLRSLPDNALALSAG